MTATLQDIRNKVRRITKRPDVNTLSTAQLDQYINTFYVYDFPEHLRLKDMLTNFTFTTQPNQEDYDLPRDPLSTTSVADPLAPSYTSIEPPVYIAGYQSYFTQSQESFYRLYPPIAISGSTATANGSSGPYQFTLSNFPVLTGRVIISVDDGITGSNLVANDFPVTGVLGTFTGNVDGTYINSINYVTGFVDIKFSAATQAGAPINFQIVPYVAARPSAMLFYQNKMILRPVPDSSYQVSVQAYQTFTQFLATNPAATPYIQQWWQFLALGAALKVFEDLGDFEAIMQYRPLFDEQRCLCERRTLVQMASERAATIYSDMQQLQFGTFYGVQ